MRDYKLSEGSFADHIRLPKFASTRQEVVFGKEPKLWYRGLITGGSNNFYEF